MFHKAPYNWPFKISLHAPPKGVGKKILRVGGQTEKTRLKIAPLSLPLLYQNYD